MPLRNNIAPINLPKEDKTLKAILELIDSSKSSNEEMVAQLLKVVEALSNKRHPETPKPEVTVNMDVERIIRAFPKQQKQEAPVVNIDFDSLKDMIQKEEKEIPSYSFEFKRDGHGRIESAIARPVGE